MMLLVVEGLVVVVVTVWNNDSGDAMKWYPNYVKQQER